MSAAHRRFPEGFVWPARSPDVVLGTRATPFGARSGWLAAPDHGHSGRVNDDSLRSSAGALTFTASRRKWFGMLAVFAVFVAAGLYLALGGDSVVIGWILVVFFGTGLLLSIWQVIAPGSLVVTDATIEVSHMGRHWSRDLARCGPFAVWRNPVARQELVVFDHPEDEAHKLSGVSRELSGHSSALPDTYGHPAGELARTLNEARARAQSGADGTVP